MPLNFIFAIIAKYSCRLIRLLPVVLLGSAVLLLTACDDDDDGSNDTAAPTAEIHFPGYYGLTDGDTVVVTGSASDANTITRVRVMGVDATSADGFATWRATVPLEPGDNLLEVETTDEFSNIDTIAATLQVKSSAYLQNPTAIALDAAHGRMLAIDSISESIMAVDLDSGALIVLSGSAIPDTSNILSVPSDITVDTANNRALVVDDDAIVAVNLETGARSILSSNTIPDANNPLQLPVDIAVDVANNRLLALDGGRVIAVDLDTGARSVLSSIASPGPDGPAISLPVGITIDAANNRALVVQTSNGFSSANVMAVDLDSGERTILSDNAIPDASNPLLFTTSIALDAAHGRTLVANSGGLLAVDLVTGARSVLLPSSGGDPFVTLDNLVLDAANNRVFAIDGFFRTIVAIDLDSSARSLLPTADTPDASKPFGTPDSIVLDPSHGRALVVDSFLQAVVAVDLDTGARNILSDGTVPDSDNGFDGPIGITLDTAHNRALVIDSSLSSVLAVDLDTGARTILSDGAIQASNPLLYPSGITLDAANNRALVTIQGLPDCCHAVMSVDLDTGARTILSDNASPDSSNPFGRPLGIELDSANDRALVLADPFWGGEALLTVKLETGARTILSNFETPDSSNPFSYPVSIALDSSNNRALVVDASRFYGIGLRSITSVDLGTGARTILSDGATPDTHNWLYSPGGIALDAARNRALVVDRQSKAVVAVELTSGERVIVSK